MLFSWKNISRPIIALSPMADMTDSAFCQTVKEIANPIIFREMVSAEAVVRRNEKTCKMTAINPSERPLIQQIFGADPEHMAEAARIIVAEQSPEGIDINMGCPANKITKNFNGAALMKEPERAADIVRAIKDAINIPVSVKIRAGWSDPTECLSFAEKLQEAGADLITVHGRTKTQGYTGFSNWGIVREVKKRVSIPVLLNGDIFSAEDAKRALELTGADGIVIARGALGNPWIFAQTSELLNEGRVKTNPTIENHARLILKHAKHHIQQYGEEGLVTFRKHLVWYLKGQPTMKTARSVAVRISTLSELETMLLPFLSDTSPYNALRLTSPQPKIYDIGSWSQSSCL